MNLKEEKRRILAMEEYGVNTNAAWNRYGKEWDRQHPILAKVNRVGFIGISLAPTALAIWSLINV